MTVGETVERGRRQWWARQWRELYDAAARGSGGDALGPKTPEDAFEQWLIEKWLRQVRSPEFRASVQGQQLMAEWERG